MGISAMRSILVLLATLPLSAAFAPQPRRMSSTATLLRAADNENAAKPFAVVVQASIEPDRMAEFLELIQKNAEATRKEPGCIRFDVLRMQESPNEFFFYEVYKNEAAVDYHKKQPHYNLWADFKATGGTIESVSYKTDAEFLT
jgi:autoinducer 2-degrading protein